MHLIDIIHKVSNMTTHPLDDGLPIFGDSGDITDPDERYAFFENLVSEKLNMVRTERNKKLAECDWVITMHKEKGTNIPAAWKTYRQALRDITEGFNNDTEIVWPEPPA
jgi:hypothetical protein|tara:strand:- start:124 stop:450 length:327 start_codon:yes stop_codon:yes gene_type:complete